MSCDDGKGEGGFSLTMEPKDEAGGAFFLKQQLWMRKMVFLIVTIV